MTNTYGIYFCISKKTQLESSRRQDGPLGCGVLPSQNASKNHLVGRERAEQRFIWVKINKPLTTSIVLGSAHHVEPVEEQPE